MVHLYTAICGHHLAKPRRYCGWSAKSADAAKICWMLAEHCLKQHNGKMKGEVVYRNERTSLQGRVN